MPHILLQLDQFDLEMYEFLDVVVILRGLCGSDRSPTTQYCSTSAVSLANSVTSHASVLGFVLRLHDQSPPSYRDGAQLSPAQITKPAGYPFAQRFNQTIICGIEERNCER